MSGNGRDDGRLWRDAPVSTGVGVVPPGSRPALPSTAGVATIARRMRSTDSELRAGVVGMVIFLGTEIMFFGGLMSAFVILRAGAPAWPPPGQPRLPIAVTGANTLVLLVSAVAMYRARRWSRATTDRHALAFWLMATAALGTIFLTIQGVEWMRLIRHGLTLASSVYGALFYTLIGAHAVHVLGALVVLLVVTVRAARGRYTVRQPVAVELCWLYWCFVVGLWPVLYGLVYFA